jgi:hypothetical protein
MPVTSGDLLKKILLFCLPILISYWTSVTRKLDLVSYCHLSLSLGLLLFSNFFLLLFTSSDS